MAKSRRRPSGNLSQPGQFAGRLWAGAPVVGGSRTASSSQRASSSPVHCGWQVPLLDIGQLVTFLALRPAFHPTDCGGDGHGQDDDRDSDPDEGTRVAVRWPACTLTAPSVTVR